MANKHICCLKPRRCSVCKIQMRYSSDTLCVRSLVQLSSWKYSLRPHWTGKLVCKGGEPCCERCIVLCRVKEEQQTHSMNYWKNRPGKGKCCLALVGRLDLWVAQHSFFSSQVLIESTYNFHLRHTGEHECDIYSLRLMSSVSLKSRMCGVSMFLTSSPGCKGLV